MQYNTFFKTIIIQEVLRKSNHCYQFQFSQLKAELASVENARNTSQFTVLKLKKRLADQTNEYEMKTKDFESKSQDAIKVRSLFIDYLSFFTIYCVYGKQTIAELREKIKKATSSPSPAASKDHSAANTASSVSARQRSRLGLNPTAAINHPSNSNNDSKKVELNKPYSTDSSRRHRGGTQ